MERFDRERRRGTPVFAVLLVALVLPLCSCAFYNTYYLARKYYERGTVGLPYPVEKPLTQDVPNFTKSIEYSKKLIAQYPNDKWVDDAYLLWARALLGTDDPRETVRMLEEFPTRYPKSSLRKDAVFYLGVGYLNARKYSSALRAFDEFIAQAPKHKLTPYAHLERARTLTALDRPADAAAAASELIDKFPKSKLRERAYVARAEARFDTKAFDLAQQDFRRLGARSRSDDERFEYMMREADCLEGARQYEAELKLLNEALAHEQAPIQADTTGGRTITAATLTGPALKYGRLQVRIGTAHLQAGRFDQALTAFQRVAQDYRRTELAAEAQYRIGYAYETSADDFDKARAEYARVKEHGGASNYVTQANQRLGNLERLAQFRGADGDSSGKKSEAGFLLAELYLFQLEKPERAIEEYHKIAEEFAGTPIAAKALTAEAWVLSRKLERGREADSLFWAVVRQYPATESQLAARDYLEATGVTVPSDLIKMPERKIAVVDTMPELTPPPETPPLFTPGASEDDGDSLQIGPRAPSQFAPTLAPGPRGLQPRGNDDFPRGMVPPVGRPDSTGRFDPASGRGGGAEPSPPDSSIGPPAPGNTGEPVTRPGPTSSPGPDTSIGPPVPDPSFLRPASRDTSTFPPAPRDTSTFRPSARDTSTFRPSARDTTFRPTPRDTTFHPTPRDTSTFRPAPRDTGKASAPPDSAKAPK